MNRTEIAAKERTEDAKSFRSQDYERIGKKEWRSYRAFQAGSWSQCMREGKSGSARTQWPQGKNGTVTAWGADDYGETRVPSGLSNVASIAGGYYF